MKNWIKICSQITLVVVTRSRRSGFGFKIFCRPGTDRVLTSIPWSVRIIMVHEFSLKQQLSPSWGHLIQGHHARPSLAANNTTHHWYLVTLWPLHSTHWSFWWWCCIDQWYWCLLASCWYFILFYFNDDAKLSPSIINAFSCCSEMNLKGLSLKLHCIYFNWTFLINLDDSKMSKSNFWHKT